MPRQGLNRRKVLEAALRVVDEEGLEELTMRRLAKEEAIFAGMSSGGAVMAASKLVENMNAGVVVCIICDRGDRYLSSGIFNEEG